MSDALSDDIKSDFVNELKDYIPLLRDKAEKLNGLPPDASDTNLTELHRLVHAIRGASALIKLNNLSEVASEFESIVEAIMNGRLTFDPAVFNAAIDTIEYFDAYARQAPCNDAFNPSLREGVLACLRDVVCTAASNEGQDILSELLKSADQQEHDEALAFEPGDISFEAPEEDDQVALADSEFPGTQEPLPSEESGAPSGNAETEELEFPHTELLSEFYQEAEDHFQDLGKAIGELEDNITVPTSVTPESKELLRLVRRSVHTIKGASAIVKLKSISSWGHEFENILDWLYEEANQLSPAVIRTIADATDILEHLVTTPKKADPSQMDRLRETFKQIIETDQDAGSHDRPGASSKSPHLPAETIEVVLPPEDRPTIFDAAPKNGDPCPPCSPFDQSQSMRVDLNKVKSLVNLGGELTIALSAFDQNMEGLGSLIGEIDRTHFRLKDTARDLEVGYEGKAIGKVETAQEQTSSAPAISVAAAVASEFDLLELDRYSELNLIIRSLSETASDAGTISHQLSKIYSGFKGYLHHLQILISELNEKTMRMRMTPMSVITNRMRSTVRETASQLGKKAHLTIKGEHIELDKMVWDKVADPLMHLLRNAVDHGVESMEARQAAGKPETADIQLEATYQGNQVILRISDDGAGIDYDGIRDTAVPVDPLYKDDAISIEEMNEMIFQPGFSSREIISEISGRGVGLDVVKENILGLNGNVSVEKSEADTGTTFLITLPLTMAVIKALIFDIGGRRYATALYDIKEILRVNPKDLSPQGDGTIYVGGQRLPFYNLSEILYGPERSPAIREAAQWPLLLIIQKGTWKAAVTVDRMYSQREVVIKSLGTHLGQIKGIAGATVLGDGKVVPILNLEELIMAEAARPLRPFRMKRKEKIHKPLEVMVVDDSVTIRNVLSHLMKRQGWKVVAAKDGAEALEFLYNGLPDVVILDVEMPRMNGYEFMSNIRAQDKFDDLPVIMHTSRASQKHREKADTLGVNAFVTKPYEEDDFVALVKKLGRYKQLRPLREQLRASQMPS